MANNSGNVVQHAVNHLLAQDAEYNQLREKYILNNQSGGVNQESYIDTMNTQPVSQKEMNQIGKMLSAGKDESYNKVNKFAKAMHKKYKSRDMNLSDVVTHARRHATKIGLQENEFRLFEILYQSIDDKSNNNFPNVDRNGPLGDVLGTVQAPFVSNKSLKVSSSDRPHVDEIMRIAALNKQEHARCVLQASAYSAHGMHDILVQSLFIPGVHNRSCAVHPLIVALFGPKITILDERMLHSNLARIIVDRLRGQPIRNRSDFELFIDLTTDQQDSVCDSKSVFADILKRVEVQEMLRRAVWQMRGGQLYECNTSGLITVLDNCKLNPADSPHLMYIRDEGTMLRRILHTFSFKPTHVTTRPIFAMTGLVPPVGRLDQLSMITVQLPHHALSDNSVSSVPLEMGLNTPHWYLENGVVIPKQNNIVYSREVIFFYVNRRYQSIGAAYQSAYQFSRLPVATSGFNRINTTAVEAKVLMRIHQRPYVLRSIVCVNFDDPNDSGIRPYYSGCHTIVVKPDRITGGDSGIPGDSGWGHLGDQERAPWWTGSNPPQPPHDPSADPWVKGNTSDIELGDVEGQIMIYKYDPYSRLTKGFIDSGMVDKYLIPPVGRAGLVPPSSVRDPGSQQFAASGFHAPLEFWNGKVASGEAAGVGQLSKTGPYWSIDREDIDAIQKTGTIFIYSQPMEDVRGKYPGYPNMPHHLPQGNQPRPPPQVGPTAARTIAEQKLDEANRHFEARARAILSRRARREVGPEPARQEAWIEQNLSQVKEELEAKADAATNNQVMTSAKVTAARDSRKQKANTAYAAHLRAQEDNTAEADGGDGGSSMFSSISDATARAQRAAAATAATAFAPTTALERRGSQAGERED